MRIFRNRVIGAMVLAVAVLAAACSSGGGSKDGTTIVIGSASFGESELIAEMYAQLLENDGYNVERKFSLGTREIYAAALEAGEIHLVPEYTGSALTYLGGTATNDVETTVSELRSAWGPRGVSVLAASPAQDKNGFVVTGEFAAANSLAKVSDLTSLNGSLSLGGPPECPDRPFCLLGLQSTYGLVFAEFRPLDAGGPLTVTSLKEGEIDVALLFTTDGVIVAEGFVLLEDDQGLQPAENVVPAIATTIVEEYGEELTALLDSLSAELTTEALTELNRRVGYVGEDPAEVANDWLESVGLL